MKEILEKRANESPFAIELKVRENYSSVAMRPHPKEHTNVKFHYPWPGASFFTK